jgi:transposase
LNKSFKEDAMPGSYSLDLRTRVISDVDRGMLIEAAGRKFSVSTRVIFQWLALREETGELVPRKGKTGPKPKLDSRRAEILAAVEDNPSITLEELKTKLELPGCLQTLWNALRRWGIVLKKSHASSRAATC